MKIEPIYCNGFINYLHTPESDEERDAMLELALRSKEAEETQALLEALEQGEKENGNNSER